MTRTEALAASGVPQTEALAEGFRYALAFGVCFPILAVLITLFSLHEKRLS